MDPKPTPRFSTPRQRSDPAQYVYCVIRAKGASSFGAIGIGDPPGEVRVIKSGDLAAVVSDAPCEALKPTRQNVLAHERVNDRVMLQRTVVPMAFGNVFKTREGVAALLRSARAPLTEVLERMDGKIELGLKVLWDPEVEKRECAERDEELRRIRVGSLRARLMRAQLCLESGEMTEGDFGALEGEIIARLSGLRAEEEQGPIEWASAEIEAVEVSSVPEKGARHRQRFHRRNGP